MVGKSVEDLKRIGNLNTEYPLSQLIISMGFFLVYFLEEISHWIITRFPDKPYPPIQKKFNNFITNSILPKEKRKTNNPRASSIEDNCEKTDKTDGTNEENAAAESEDSVEQFVHDLAIDNNPENKVYDTLSLHSEVTKENRKDVDIDKVVDKVVEVQKELIECKIKSQQQLIRFLVTVVALSFHALFEGLAIGIQDNVPNIWYMFIAVCIHSTTILFCMGLELLLARAKIKFICLHMLALASASSIGVFLGILASFENDMETRAKSTAVVLLEGLSAGTILYITFFEILNREKERRVWRITRAVCILGGFSLMAFLQYLEMYN